MFDDGLITEIFLLSLIEDVNRKLQTILIVSATQQQSLLSLPESGRFFLQLISRSYAVQFVVAQFIARPDGR